MPAQRKSGKKKIGSGRKNSSEKERSHHADAHSHNAPHKSADQRHNDAEDLAHRGNLLFAKTQISIKGICHHPHYHIADTISRDQKQDHKRPPTEALEKINSAVAQMSGANYVYRYFMETIGQIELVQIASIAGAGAPQEAIDNFFKDYSLSTDKKVAERMIEIYKDNVDTTYWLPIFNEYGTEELVNRMYSESCFTSPEKIAAADEETVKNDIATRIVSELQTTIIPVMVQIDDVYDQYYEGKKEYTAGLLEMKDGEPIYPDANLTMRLTYGSVKSYSPRDAVLYNYYTTLDGVMEKEDPDNWEFVVPEKLKELYDAKDFGRYAMEVNGETKMPVAFISNNDITGGNSGSPIMNSKGELIGLAFDGNWEAMSGDIIFEPELQRCINVDIRYVLFIVDKFGGAGYLLDEMTIIE